MRLRRALPLLLVPAVLLVALARVAVRRAERGAREVPLSPLSPLSAGRRVGPDWPERAGITVDAGSAGEPDGSRRHPPGGGTRDSSRQPVVGEMCDSNRHPPAGEMDDLRAVHEMWVLGRRFLTVTYRTYASTSTS